MEFEKAEQRLREIYNADDADAPMRDEDGEPSWGPVVVSESISRADFREWMDRHEGDLRRWTYEPLTPDTGRVIVYSWASPAHQCAISLTETEITIQLQLLGGIGMSRTLHSMWNLDIDIGDRDAVADLVMEPRGLLRPNLVIEVAHRNESRSWLEAKLLRWMQATTTTTCVSASHALRRHSDPRHTRGLCEQQHQRRFGQAP